MISSKIAAAAIMFCSFVPRLAAADGLIGFTIKADLKAMARVCRMKTGACSDVETPAKLGVYFGTKGTVYVYIGSAGGLELPTGQWANDNQGHNVRWAVSGNRAVWEAFSESYLNTITFTRRGSRCVVQNAWHSSNPDIRLEGRGVQVYSCVVQPGNTNS